MTRRAGCLNGARPDLWEAAGATPLPTRRNQLRCELVPDASSFLQDVYWRKLDRLLKVLEDESLP